MSLPKPEPKKEWSRGLSSEAVFLVDNLEQQGKLGVIVDCGAGEGRHSVYAARKGAEKVLAIEEDPEEVAVIRRKKKDANLAALQIIEGDVLKELAALNDESVNGVVDCGMSHCLTEVAAREEFASLVFSKLKPGGLYSITHFSENETLSTGHFQTDIVGLKNLFSEDDWVAIMPWQEASWKREDGQKHYAYKAVLKKKGG